MKFKNLNKDIKMKPIKIADTPKIDPPKSVPPPKGLSEPKFDLPKMPDPGNIGKGFGSGVGAAMDGIGSGIGSGIGAITKPIEKFSDNLTETAGDFLNSPVIIIGLATGGLLLLLMLSRR
jgi:hypothetical protein